VRAETLLLKLASALELYYNENNSYQKATLTNLGFQPILSDQSYQLSIELANDREYIISANPMNSQTADTLCGKLSLHSTGEKNSGGSGKYNACW
jgi:type IV pilus assembly protein PilE